MNRLASFVAIVILCTPASADIVPTPGTLRVKPVFDKSDLVCFCQAKSLTVLGRTELGAGPKGIVNERVRALLGVENVYKSTGNIGGPIFVQFDRVVSNSGAVTSARPVLLSGETALLFLTETPAGAYEFADPFLGVIPLRSIPAVADQSGIEGLQIALIRAIQTAGHQDRVTLLQTLQGFDNFTAEALTVVNSLAESDDSETAIPAMGVLLKTKTPDTVERLAKYLKDYKSDVQPPGLISVGSELGQVADPNALRSLEDLSSSRFVAVRYGAMDAIRKVRDPRSIPTLIARLDYPDSTVQYVAVITLAEILGKYNDDVAPSMYLFDKNPAYYIGLWKQWWVDEGSKLYSPDVAQ